MRNNRSLALFAAVFAVVGGILAAQVPSALAATKPKTIYAFGHAAGDGAIPQADLIFDAAGNMYSTTEVGGENSCGGLGCGTVFEMSPVKGGTWSMKVLYNFCSLENCDDGYHPYAPVIFDTAGNLWGTTYFGGPITGCGGISCGAFYELSPGPNNTWTGKGFPFGYYAFPEAGFTLDSSGHLWSAYPGFGEYSAGEAFAVDTGGFGFDGTDGATPYGGLVADANGNVYGTTYGGGEYSGLYGGGVVYELSPNGDGSWSETVLYNFCAQSECADGAGPVASMIFDAAGNLYGTTTDGGAQGVHCGGAVKFGCGTVFELTPGPGGVWTETVLHSFGGANDGSAPSANVTFDADGNLWGTTFDGGAHGYGCHKVACGTLFELTPGAGGWTETVVYSFSDGSDGGGINSGVIFDKAGNLYGTAAHGGPYHQGLVYELPKTFIKTATALTSSPNPSASGEEVTFTAVVSSSSGAPPDGESVSFVKGTLTLGTGTLSGGTATFVTSTLPVGTTAVRAVYAGDSKFAGSKSIAVKQVVN
jgi:hypothetical protein